jgi:hypothetical protein
MRLRSLPDLLSDIKSLDQLKPHVLTRRVTACPLLSFKCTSEVYPNSMEIAWQYPPVRYLKHRTLGVDIVSHALTDWQGALTRRPPKDSMLGRVNQHLSN